MMSDTYCVYRHISPDGKFYIGITSFEPEKRWRGGYGHNVHFSRAIAKYGWDNFVHEVLDTNLSKEEAEQKEKELIAKYKTTDRNFGYNLTSGGEIGKKHSAESIEKMSLAKKGKYTGDKNSRYCVVPSEETREKIRKALTGKFAGEKNPNFGKRMTDEQKQKISQARKGKHYPKNSEALKKSPKVAANINAMKLPISQYSLEGLLIRTWPSAPDAAEAIVGTRKAQCNICNCANGKIKTAYGFIWKHTEEVVR